MRREQVVCIVPYIGQNLIEATKLLGDNRRGTSLTSPATPEAGEAAGNKTGVEGVW